MAETLEPFEVTVLWPSAGSENGKGKQRSRLWISAASRLGAVHGVPRQLSASAERLLSDCHHRFEGNVQRAAPEAEWAAETGRELAELIFGVPEILSLFHRTRGAAVDQGRQLLVRVQATPARAAAVPWELLADPDIGPRSGSAKRSPAIANHLTFAPDAHVTRTARSRTYPVRTTSVEPPLNVLLVLSNPEGGDDQEIQFDLFEERRLLLAELQPLIDRGLLVVDSEDSATVENLRRRIGSRLRGYHIVHYLGHARPTQLKLEDGERRPRWVDVEQFNRVLTACPDLRLVFYAGCRTASQPTGQTEWPEVLGVADRTVRDACPMVVGMQALLPFRTEQVLTRFFYQALSAGQSVAQALKLARAAIRDDDLVGGRLLDWAVPSLITSTAPEAIVDPAAAVAAPPPARRRVELRLDLVEPDRDFFARQTELRRVIDVLCRRRRTRVLWIVGPPRSGKTRLVGRALDELDAVDAVLYIRAGQLLGTSGGEPHPEGPVGRLNDLVVELLARQGRHARTRDDRWNAQEWWARLIEDLIDTPFVLVIDDVDDAQLAPADEVVALGEALSDLVQRRTQARLALVASAVRPALLSAEVAPFATCQVIQPLGFRDVWQWIRRNRPVLVRFGSDRLAPYYSRLPSLEAWSELARLVTARPLADLEELVSEVAPPLPPTQTSPGDEPTAGIGAQPVPSARTKRHGESPLRVAVAGLHFVNKEAEFASAATALASAHGVGGRVVTAGYGDSAGSIAELLRIPSPFSKGAARTSDALVWLEQAVDQGADLVLLDFGTPVADSLFDSAIKSVAEVGVLTIAAGGNQKAPMWPAWYSDVLAVGALTGGRRRRLAPYAFWDPDTGKPELFAPETLAGTPFEPLVPPGTKGSSMAAVNGIAAALLVWALDRTQSADDVRNVLIGTGQPLDENQPDGPRGLDIEGAVRLARQRVVRRPLELGPLDRDGLAAATGLPANVIDDALHNLISAGEVIQTPAANGSVYRLQTSSAGRKVVDTRPPSPMGPTPAAAQV